MNIILRIITKHNYLLMYLSVGCNIVKASNIKCYFSDVIDLLDTMAVKGTHIHS